MLKYLIYIILIVGEKIGRNNIVIAKEKRRFRLLKKYIHSYSLVTNNLETNLFATKPFISNGYNGKDDINHNYWNIQRNIC